MIIGIGLDTMDIRRIERTLMRFGSRFKKRVFTEQEQARAERRANTAATYAKRFAAKEACSKALGTGLRQGVYWRDMEVVNLPSGKPTLQLRNGARARLDLLVPDGMSAQIDVTMTDDMPLAQALVIISAVATNPDRHPDRGVDGSD